MRAPKTDDPHSLPRVDDLLDDIPVQQEPGRYSDRERVADYLASAQGVEFRDLNANARREWLMRASDALRAVWSIGRLTDPVQRESEDRITRPGGWHGMMMLTDAAYRSGYEYRKAEFAPVPSVGLRDRLACELANLEYERSGRLCETEDFYADADRVLSVLHEGGTQGDGEVLRVIRDDNGYTIMLPGDGQWASSTDPRMLESYLALRLSEVAADVGLPALAPDNPWVGPSAEAGTQEEEELAVKRRLALIDRITDEMLSWDVAEEAGWDRSDAVCRAQWVVDAINDVRRPALAEAGTQELTEADRPYCPDCGMRYDEDCADCDVGDDFRARYACFASPAEAGTQEDEGDE